MRVEGKTFVVTGGGNGIGRQLVLALLSSGARVAAVDISPKGLEETKRLSGGAAESLSIHVADICDGDRVRALPEETAAAHPSMDGLVNCAGIIQPFRKTVDLDEAAIRRIMGNSGVAMNPTVKKLKSLLTLTTGAQAARAILRGIKGDRYRIFIGPDVRLLFFLYKLSPRILPGMLCDIMKRIFPERN